MSTVTRRCRHSRKSNDVATLRREHQRLERSSSPPPPPRVSGAKLFIAGSVYSRSNDAPRGRTICKYRLAVMRFIHRRAAYATTRRGLSSAASPRATSRRVGAPTPSSSPRNCSNELARKLYPNPTHIPSRDRERGREARLTPRPRSFGVWWQNPTSTCSRVSPTANPLQ